MLSQKPSRCQDRAAEPFESLPMAAAPHETVPCFICGEQAALADEQKTHIDYDCARCGPLRVTGRAFVVFPPRALATFDRPWLSAKVRAVPTTRRNGFRRLVDERWLHHWRLVTLLRADYALSEAEAEAHLARYPDADITNESVLVLVGRDLAAARN
jgi:hypothetical protein